MTEPAPPGRRLTPGQRLRAAPAPVWVYAVLTLATPPWIGLVIDARAPSDPAAWSGLAVAALLVAGVVLCWRVVWAAALCVDAFLVLAGFVAVATAGTAGVALTGAAAASVWLLLAPATRVHVFGSAVWRGTAKD